MINVGMQLQRVKLNRNGFRELRTSDRVRNDLRRRAEAVAMAAGDWTVEESPSRNRARFVVYPATFEASKEAITEMQGARALQAGRD